MKIYTYETRDDLSKEEIWIEEDDVLSSMEAKIRYAIDYGLESEYKDEDIRNITPYECRPWDGTPYEHTDRNVPYIRVILERRFILNYYEVKSVEDFLINHEREEVIYDRGYFFHKTWMDC